MRTILPPEPPHALAALRIAVPLAILISPELWQAPRWAALPPELRFAPEGLGWAVRHVPIGPSLARAAAGVLIFACGTLIAGVAARFSAAVVTFAGLYVFGLAQLSGAVIHDMHLFWISALLAVSPSAEVWSLPTRRHAPAEASLACAVPLQATRLLLAIVYFFPGYWKLASSGLAWITSDNLRNQLYWKWYQLGTTPALRIDQSPGALQLCAAAVVAFELGFVTLIWSPRSRWLAAAGGVTFHLATLWWMGVTFIGLLACYVVLIDWRRFARAVARGGAAADSTGAGATRSLPWPSALVGAIVIAAAAVQGARGATEAWPFACYPTFARIVGDAIPDLRIEAVDPSGAVRPVPDGPSTGGRSRAPQDWARAWQLAGMYGRPADPAQLRAYLDQLRARDPRASAVIAGATRLRFYAASYSVLPEQRGRAPLRRWLLADQPLRP